METKIIITKVDAWDRADLENVEARNYMDQDVKKIILDIDNTQVFDMSDFMDACNNEEIDLNNYWLTYVYKDQEELEQ